MSTARGTNGTLITFRVSGPMVLTLTDFRPIFVTPNPFSTAGVREVLQAAGLPLAPRIVAPDSIRQGLEQAGPCLAILDGQFLPPHETLSQLCCSPHGSRFVLWATRPTADLLKTALECGVHGLLSANLPVEEAAAALVRICSGERILRFDPGDGPVHSSKPLQLSAREQHLLRELAGGANNARIAAALQTSASSVKGNLSRLFHKTGARNRHELAQLCRPLLPLDEPRNNPSAPPPLEALWMLESL
jgi:DNA-binding NarL/FixJ family response regulator